MIRRSKDAPSRLKRSAIAVKKILRKWVKLDKKIPRDMIMELMHD